MQLMPRTARAMGVKNSTDPALNIQGGIKYLDWLRDRFDSKLPISDRLWFTLAAYNAGAGHVHDARRLARQLGMDPDRWFDHTEKAMLLLAEKKYARKARFGYVNGLEPVNYVRDIRQRFEAYVELSRQATAQQGPPRQLAASQLLAQPLPFCYPCTSAALRPVDPMIAPPYDLAVAETILTIH
jgi:membrane-bound lytic murein transglycosylase F